MNRPEHLADAWPSVSVVIPARDAESTIARSIDGALAQDYPGKLEIIVSDGSDRDDTARFIASRYPQVVVVPNPDHETSAGLNIAIEASSGEIIARCDAHAVFGSGYLRRAVETLRRTGAAVVGGLQVPAGKGPFQTAVGMAMTSVLGAGNSSHKIGGTEGPTDTVYLGVFRRGPLVEAGGFDETLVRNQDYELNWRLRSSGETVWLDPELVTAYEPRGSLSGLWRQYFGYGWWKAVMLRRNPRSLRLRQLAAPVLVSGLTCSVGLALLGQVLPAMALPFAYLAGLALGSTNLAVRRRNVPAGLLLPAVLSTMHIGWGLGFLFSCTAQAFDAVRPGGSGRRAPSGTRTAFSGRRSDQVVEAETETD